MIELKDKIILGIVIIAIAFIALGTNLSVSTILIVVSFSSLLFYIDEEIHKALIVCVYLVISIFLTDLIFFIPIILYDVVFSKYKIISIFSIVPIIVNYSSLNISNILITGIFLLLTIYLRYKTKKEIEKEDNFYDFRDKSTRLSFELKEKNKELLKKQDYEINIATLDERNRIAMEIHDNVGHMLSRSILQVGAMLAINENNNLSEPLESLNITLTNAMNSIRNSVHNMHDDSLKLDIQVKSIIDNFKFCPIRLDYSIHNNPENRITHTFISILKESLSNIMKHSNATNVKVIFREHPSLYQLVVQDNGTNRNTKKDFINNGIGLKNMENRIYNLNGNIYISNENGFRIFISVPKGEIDS